ncbi:MAG: hypothetical protein HZA58_07415, partial [Acidimicrobiia bacterium]|nr:hypothetical protein [Acidimicrobiia bacterium]
MVSYAATLGDIGEAIGSGDPRAIAVIIGLFLNAIMVFELRRQISLDHERRKKQATLDVWADVSETHYDARSRLTAKFGRNMEAGEAQWLFTPPPNEAAEA